MVHRKVYRERHRAIMRVLIEQYGPYEAYDMYGWGLRNPVKCKVCQSEVHSYSEWNETGYEHERCSNGCWGHTIYGLISELETKGFRFEGKLTERLGWSREDALNTPKLTEEERIERVREGVKKRRVHREFNKKNRAMGN